MDEIQILGIVLALGFGGMGLYFLWSIPESLRNHKRLDEEGQETVARITKEYFTGRVFRTNYEFISGGNVIKGSRDLKLSTKFPDGQVPLIYLEDNPDIHRIDGADMNSKASVIVLGIFGLALMGLAIFWIVEFVL